MNWKEIHDMRGAGRKSNRTMFSVSSARTAPRFAANAWIALVLVAIVAALAGARGAALPLHFFRMQDVAVILLLVAALTATAYWRPPGSFHPAHQAPGWSWRSDRCSFSRCGWVVIC